MVHSQTEELKILINKKTIAYQKQMTASILTRLSRLYQELQKNLLNIIGLRFYGLCTICN